MDLVLVLALGWGIYLFTMGIRRLKQCRTVEDIPTSSIATGAVGSLVEIYGKVVLNEDDITIAPLTGKPCAYLNLNFKYTDSLDGNYVTHIQMPPFYIDDLSGALAMVDVGGADFRVQWNTQSIHLNSANVQSLLKKYPHLQEIVHNESNVSELFDRFNRSELLRGKGDMVIREFAFFPNDHIYVIGYAQSGFKKRWKPKLSIKKFLQAKKLIQGDKSLASRFDTNQDGKLDYTELERGARTLGIELKNQKEKAKSTLQQNPLKEKVKMVFQHSRAHPLTIVGAEKGDMESLATDHAKYGAGELIVQGVMISIIMLVVWTLKLSG